MTDVELDERVTALEENDGGGSTQNGKIDVDCVSMLSFGTKLSTTRNKW